jgi:hypothetical protein
MEKSTRGVVASDPPMLAMMIRKIIEATRSPNLVFHILGEEVCGGGCACIVTAKSGVMTTAIAVATGKSPMPGKWENPIDIGGMVCPLPICA